MVDGQIDGVWMGGWENREFRWLDCLVNGLVGLLVFLLLGYIQKNNFREGVIRFLVLEVLVQFGGGSVIELGRKDGEVGGGGSVFIRGFLFFLSYFIWILDYERSIYGMFFLYQLFFFLIRYSV